MTPEQRPNSPEQPRVDIETPKEFCLCSSNTDDPRNQCVMCESIHASKSQGSRTSIPGALKRASEDNVFPRQGGDFSPGLGGSWPLPEDSPIMYSFTPNPKRQLLDTPQPIATNPSKLLPPRFEWPVAATSVPMERVHLGHTCGQYDEPTRTLLCSSPGRRFQARTIDNLTSHRHATRRNLEMLDSRATITATIRSKKDFNTFRRLEYLTPTPFSGEPRLNAFEDPRFIVEKTKKIDSLKEKLEKHIKDCSLAQPLVLPDIPYSGISFPPLQLPLPILLPPSQLPTNTPQPLPTPESEISTTVSSIAPSKSAEASSIKPHKKIYSILIKRGPSTSISRESSGTKRYAFDSFDELRDDFDDWMRTNFSDPLFSWDSFKLVGPNPQKQSDINNIENLVDEFEWASLARDVSTVAYFLDEKWGTQGL
ncbi:hypothetical protein H072_10760 [Dactylellina haptotyla CBS 200.50]|uniref:Uncharacterized protein n=1 Tax=Dactylellina haptotyla (strain CBS 200.50) TaxID=1284197 RepID=S8B9P1_DACHA|nr:hypothetical protein H072_10760 [Dactylellina haptotyla CBS 200.50]